MLRDGRLSPRAGPIGGRSDLVGLSPSMANTNGRPEIPIVLIDGPVALDHPILPAKSWVNCRRRAPAPMKLCMRTGTFIVGILVNPATKLTDGAADGGHGTKT